MPMKNASSRLTFPEGIVRRRVRAMTASISASHHIFKAPDAPAPTAINRIEATAITGVNGNGCGNQPHARREHHKRHYPRLQEGENVADFGVPFSACDCQISHRDQLPDAESVGPSRNPYFERFAGILLYRVVKPFFIRLLAYDFHRYRHIRVILAAQFGTLAKIDSFHFRSKP